MPGEAIPTIRRSLETHLQALASPGLVIAWENVAFIPGDSPYLESRLLPADPDSSMMGATYIERGIYQVAIITPPGRGPAQAEQIAAQVREHFRRGTTLIRDGIKTIIVGVPSQARGYPDNGKWRTPVSISWQAQAFT